MNLNFVLEEKESGLVQDALKTFENKYGTVNDFEVTFRFLKTDSGYIQRIVEVVDVNQGHTMDATDWERLQSEEDELIKTNNMKTNVSLIVAMTNNDVIGYTDSEGKENLPWTKLKDDMKHFRETTTGNVVILGRKTWDSFGSKPLPKRCNIIMTKSQNPLDLVPHIDDKSIDHSNVVVVNGFYDAMQEAYIAMLPNTVDNPAKKIYVIGGAQIYDLFMSDTENIVDELIITRVDKVFLNEEGQTPVYFPEYDKEDWVLHSTTTYKKDEERNDHDFTVDVFHRKPAEEPKEDAPV